MSVDILQEKIRKMKNPSVVLFEADPDLVPPCFMGEDGVLGGLERYFGALLDGLKGVVPGVRFGFGGFALAGAEGLECLARLMRRAGEAGFYVLLDLPEMLTPSAAKICVAEILAGGRFPCHGVVTGMYLGSDILQPMKALCKKEISVFAVARTSNKSAVELQDLLTGGRLVHTAAADVINRHGETVVGKSGYGQIGSLAAAASADSLRTLRSKYSRLFLLLDGFDYPNANAKNCSFAFDRFGHGAAACAAGSVTGAWRDSDSGREDPVGCAVQVADRMKKNLTRYVTIL